MVIYILFWAISSHNLLKPENRIGEKLTGSESIASNGDTIHSSQKLSNSLLVFPATFIALSNFVFQLDYFYCDFCNISVRND